MSKRLLIHYPVLNLGGAEMSILRLVRGLADRGWQVEVVVTTGGGPMEARLDPRAKLTRLRSRPSGNAIAAARTPSAFLRAVPDALTYAWQRLRERVVSVGFLFRRYDAAAVGLHGLSPAFCCTFVRADRRLHFIRNDVGEVDRRGKVTPNIERYHERIDAYVCVAQSVLEALVRRYPYVAPKAVTIYNLLAPEDMRRQAEGEPDPFAAYGSALKLLTVCRLLEEAKGLKRMAEVCRRLRDEGLDFYWFVAGDGPDRAVLEAKIRDLGLQDRLILLGRQANPFPYYRHADVVAVLSYYEGLCGAVNEAKVMGRPVIATTFSGITEQIEDGVGGLIVGNDEDAIVEGMRRILTDADLRARLARTPLAPAILDDEAKLDALEALMGGGRP